MTVHPDSASTAAEFLRVPYGQTVHGEAEIAAVTHVLRTSTQMGTHVREFERRIAELFSKRYGVMVNSGSSANELAVQLLGLTPNSEVITPALTFATTVAPLVRAGAVPVFVDVEPDTFNVDVALIEEAITPRTRALMVPSLLGNMSDWDAIAEVARRFDLLVIEDSADTLGATLRGTSTGTRSDISTTSFYGSHVINCAGNGGMLCVNSGAWADRARLLRSWGRESSLFVDSEDAECRFSVELDGIEYDAKFVFSEVGFNFEPSELGAAFGLVQLGRLESNIGTRIQHFERHLKFFREYADWFVVPRQSPDVTTGWLAFPLVVRDDAPFARSQLQRHFEQQGIQTRTVFTGNILRQPGFAYIRRREAAGGYPNADWVMRGGLLIGCHHGLIDDHIDYVHRQFQMFVSSHL